MEAMTMFEKYYTPEQLEALAARKETLGEEAMREAQAEWPRLITRVREEMEKGTDPGAPDVQKLAARWQSLIQAFSGGDEGIEASLGKMYRSEPEMASQHGLDQGIFNYLAEAFKAGS
jgi:hypothetical protein